MYSSSQSCHTATGTHMPYRITVLPATRQRWHSRPYPSRRWYLIKQLWRDAKLSWPSWLVTYRDFILYKLNGRDGRDDNRFVLHLKALSEHWSSKIIFTADVRFWILKVEHIVAFAAIFSNIFTAHAQKRLFMNFLCKFRHHRSIPRPRFPIRVQNFGDSATFSIDFCIL